MLPSTLDPRPFTLDPRLVTLDPRPSTLDQKANSNSRIWDMIDDCNINNLSKNQVFAVFNSRAIRRSVSSKFIEICMGRHVGGCHPDGNQHGDGKPTETSVTEFCYKSVNLSLEELKNIKIILFLIQELVQIAKFPGIRLEISHFLTNSAGM